MASCFSFSCSGVNSISVPGVIAAEGLEPDVAVVSELVDVMSSSDTAEETAELAGVLKCLEANLTFQN